MRRRISGRRLAGVALAVAAGTLALRLTGLLQAGGLFGAASIDDGVHYAAAASLLAGRLPYRDFLFLHPPGIVLALLPFAALARVVGDADAFACARAVFIAVGAGSTGLVVVVLRRFGPAAGVAGAAVGAASFPIVFAERSALLEPLGAAGLLGALALLVDPSSRRRRIAAGVLLGLVAVVKLPFVLPALIVALAARRDAAAVLAAAATTAAAVCSPFLVLAGGAMVQQVVLDQAGRPRVVGSFGARLGQIFPPPVLAGVPVREALLGMLLLVAGLVAVAVLTPGARRFAALLVADIAMLLAGPSFFGHYAILAALPAALLVGVGVARLEGVVHGRGTRAAALIAAAVVIGALVLGAWTPKQVGRLTTAPLPHGLVAAVRAVPGCVTADVATALVEADALTRQLQRGCPLWPDVTGWQYADGAADAGGPERDPRYQRRLLHHLLSGDAVLVTGRDDGLSQASLRRLRALPVLWRSPEGVLRDVRGCWTAHPVAARRLRP